MLTITFGGGEAFSVVYMGVASFVRIVATSLEVSQWFVCQQVEYRRTFAACYSS